VPKGSENIAREAAWSAGFWFLVGIITYVGISLVIKIEATKTRLFLVASSSVLLSAQQNRLDGSCNIHMEHGKQLVGATHRPAKEL
jgi:hypothetical protein